MIDPRERPEEPRGTAASRSPGGADKSPREAAREPRRAGHDMDSDRMTEGQRAYLAQLCEQAGEPFEEDLSIAQASERIHELEQRAPHAG